jgi:hypothetical protein
MRLVHSGELLMRSVQPLLNRSCAVLLALICGSLLIPAAYALDATPEPAKTTAIDQNLAAAGQEGAEEVSVEAHKLKLSRLRIEINKAVDNFYDVFNQANTEPEYETHCSDERRTDSYTVHHICRARFQDDANEQETQGFFYGYATTPAASLIILRGRGYKKRLEELIHRNPQVRQAATEFDALTQQYATVSREKVKAN